MKKILQKIIWNVNALWKALFILAKYRKKVSTYTQYKDQPVVQFHLTKMNYRFYVPIIRHFSTNGYICSIYTNYKFLSNSEGFFNWISDLNNVFISFRRLHHCSLLIKDDEVPCYSSVTKSVIISDQAYDEALKPRKEDLIPFSMHPDQYINLRSINFEQLRSLRRKVKIFFSGNISSEGYDDEILNKLHSKLGRRQILNLLRENFDKKISNFVNGSDEYKNEILLLTSNFWVEDKQKEHKVAKDKWFKTLSQADFFLACPGFSHPMCHNLIESMAVGCIPILEHNEYLQPNLIDNFNCISYKGAKELLEKINYVLNMDVPAVENMRKNVIIYYEENLTSKAVVKAFNQVANNSTLYYYSSAQSVQLYKQKFESSLI